MAIPVQEVHRGAFSSLEAAHPAPHGSVAGALLPSLSIAISALILAAAGAPLLRRSAARSRGRGAPRADRGGRTRRRHLLWPAAVAGGCCVQMQVWFSVSILACREPGWEMVEHG